MKVIKLLIALYDPAFIIDISKVIEQHPINSAAPVETYIATRKDKHTESSKSDFMVGVINFSESQNLLQNRLVMIISRRFIVGGHFEGGHTATDINIATIASAGDLFMSFIFIMDVKEVLLNNTVLQ